MIPTSNKNNTVSANTIFLPSLLEDMKQNMYGKVQTLQSISDQKLVYACNRTEVQ